METPPELPPPSPQPLGKAFYITLLGPVAAMGFAALASLVGKAAEGLSFGLSLFTLPAMLVCSIICAAWIGRRKGAGMGFLAFFCIQVLYVGVAVGGCSAVLANNPLNFH